MGSVEACVNISFTTVDTDRICDVLRSLPVSQRTLAKKAGVSPSLLSQICSGERAATKATLEALAMALEAFGAECEAAAGELREAAQEAR